MCSKSDWSGLPMDLGRKEFFDTVVFCAQKGVTVVLKSYYNPSHRKLMYKTTGNSLQFFRKKQRNTTHTPAQRMKMLNINNSKKKRMKKKGRTVTRALEFWSL